jgi:uncharacterized protein (TIGR00661 family)
MKIFYAVQATGNGHISRAETLLPYLKEYGEVDVFLSGSNYALKSELPIAYRSKGVSLKYDKQKGSIDIWDTIRSASFRKIWNEAKFLPVDKYDLIINDFECVTALACKLKKVPSIQFGHQASFKSQKVPRPIKRDKIGELVLSNYAKADQYLGLHFSCYDDFICEPIIKQSILESEPSDMGHITVYLSHIADEIQFRIFRELKNYHFHVFSPTVEFPYIEGNIKYFPVNKEMFTQSLIHSYGVVTGAGFETPAEALYMGKKLMVIPLKGQYEQQCNAAALQEFGIPSLETFDSYFAVHFNKWIFDTPSITLGLTMSTRDIVKRLFDMHASRESTIQVMKPFKFEAAAL